MALQGEGGDAVGTRKLHVLPVRHQDGGVPYGRILFAMVLPFTRHADFVVAGDHKDGEISKDKPKIVS